MNRSLDDIAYKSPRTRRQHTETKEVTLIVQRRIDGRNACEAVVLFGPLTIVSYGQ